jgi:hypothetical protein
MSIKYYFDAIQALCPGHAVMLEDHDLDRITWLGNNPPESPPTREDIIAKAAELQVEADWIDLRKTRTEKLQETDYLGASDMTMTDEMRAYRQALRDLPENTTDPANPVWPTKPS